VDCSRGESIGSRSREGREFVSLHAFVDLFAVHGYVPGRSEAKAQLAAFYGQHSDSYLVANLD
jgi:hypothetical protein